MTPQTITQAILDHYIELSERAQAHILRTRPALDRRYALIEYGHHYLTVEADDLDHALEIARGNVDADNYGEITETTWIDVMARHVLTGETARDTVQLDPPEPDCVDGQAHDWQSPHDVVGGLTENPGVWGHGGGVQIVEVCAHCGGYRETDTWAQRPDTGEQGLESVSYRDPDEQSEAWLAEQADEDGTHAS